MATVAGDRGRSERDCENQVNRRKTYLLPRDRLSGNSSDGLVGRERRKDREGRGRTRIDGPDVDAQPLEVIEFSRASFLACDVPVVTLPSEELERVTASRSLETDWTVLRRKRRFALEEVPRRERDVALLRARCPLIWLGRRREERGASNGLDCRSWCFAWGRSRSSDVGRPKVAVVGVGVDV